MRRATADWYTAGPCNHWHGEMRGVVCPNCFVILDRRYMKARLFPLEQRRLVLPPKGWMRVKDFCRVKNLTRPTLDRWLENGLVECLVYYNKRGHQVGVFYQPAPALKFYEEQKRRDEEQERREAEERATGARLPNSKCHRPAFAYDLATQGLWAEPGLSFGRPTARLPSLDYYNRPRLYATLAEAEEFYPDWDEPPNITGR